MLSAVQRRRMAACLALVVLTAACGGGGDEPDAPVEQSPGTDEPASEADRPDGDTGTETDDGGADISSPDDPPPLEEVELGDLEVASERAAALVRRDTEDVLDAVEDLASDVLYLSESAEACDGADGTRYGQTVLLRVEPGGRAEVLTRLGGRFEEAGFDLTEDGDELAATRDDGGLREVGPQGQSTLVYVAVGSCESTAEGAPTSLADASTELELPAASVFDALAGDADVGQEGTTMACEDGRVASFLTLSGQLEAAMGPGEVQAALGGAFPGGRRLEHGPQATDVVTEQGTVTVRTRGDRLTVTTRTRCAEGEEATP